MAIQDTGNKVSRRATISGPQNIILGGKTIISNGAIIRGDLKRAGPGHAVVISLGRYCLVGEGCVMRYVSVVILVRPKQPQWPVQASLQDISRRIQLLPDENRGLCSHRCQYNRRSGDYWQPCGDWEELCYREYARSPLTCSTAHLLMYAYTFASAGKIHNHQGLCKNCG